MSFGKDFNEDRVVVMETDNFCRMCFVDSNDRFSFAIAIFLVVHRRRILVIVLSPAQQLSKHIERCDWVNTNGVRPIIFLWLDARPTG